MRAYAYLYQKPKPFASNTLVKCIGCLWKPPAKYTHNSFWRIWLMFFYSLIPSMHDCFSLFLIRYYIGNSHLSYVCEWMECEVFQMHAKSLVLKYVQSITPFPHFSTHIRKWAHYFDWFWIRLIMPSGTALIQYRTNYFLFVPYTISVHTFDCA